MQTTFADTSKAYAIRPIRLSPLVEPLMTRMWTNTPQVLAVIRQAELARKIPARVTCQRWTKRRIESHIKEKPHIFINRRDMSDTWHALLFHVKQLRRLAA